MAGRNPLLGDLLRLPLDVLALADFGCGPGNLLSHLAGTGAHVVGIDASAVALGIAAENARRHGVDFEACCGDFRSVALPRPFDVIVSVNSVIPPARDDVVPLLAAMRRVLKPDGRLLAILPSYDTTRYLRDLIAQRDGEEAACDWDTRHLSNGEQLLFADDGVTQQAYHSPESMADELPRAGLRIVGEPAKVRYPWALTRRFDYGDFPDAPEEIWDWYVVAQRAE
jgi:SAM-dependent methyltransferase